MNDSRAKDPTGAETHFFLAVALLFLARVTRAIKLKAKYPQASISGKSHRYMNSVSFSAEPT